MAYSRHQAACLCEVIEKIMTGPEDSAESMSAGSNGVELCHLAKFTHNACG